MPVLERTEGHLPLVEHGSYQFVDDILEVYRERSLVRQRAEQILSSRYASHTQTPAAELPPPVDALSTAAKVLEARDRYGENSPLYQELYRGHVLDCQRLVAEWYRKKKPEYFEPLKHVFVEEKQEFFSHGLSIRQMTENALLPIPGDTEEEARRVNEHVEDATPNILRSLGKIAVGSQSIRTISECTDKAIVDYAFDRATGSPHRGYAGYVPEIEKLMIRDIRLDPKTNDRYEEQVGLPGTYITHAVIAIALAEKGVQSADLNKTELHGSQILACDDLMDFVAHLDRVASEQWCTNVYMGEEVSRSTVKDYANFRSEAIRRQENLVDMAETVATFVLDLAASQVGARTALGLIEEFVKKQLLQIGKNDTVLAEQMFDSATAERLQRVVYLESIGQYEAALKEMQAAESEAPGGGFCGAGSCGLVGGVSSSLAKKVGAEPGDTVLFDKIRRCKCGSRNIVYAYNKRKVNKYCDSCTQGESNVDGRIKTKL